MDTFYLGYITKSSFNFFFSQQMGVIVSGNILALCISVPLL